MAESVELFSYDGDGDGPGRAYLRIDADRPAAHAVRPQLYGKFCEHLGANVYHGMEAQILLNCTFGKWRFTAGNGHPDGGVTELADREAIGQRIAQRAQRQGWPSAEPVAVAFFSGGAFGWFAVGGGVRLSPDTGSRGGRAQRVEVDGGDGEAGIGQWIHLPLHRTRRFEFRIVGRAVERCALRLQLAPVGGETQGAHVEVELGRTRHTVCGHIELPADAPPDALFRFALTTTEAAHVVLDRVLLYPADHVGGADPDVIRLLADSGLPLLRWPGGNFVSGYHWRDGVGSIDSRPTRTNPAWEGLEFNLFGTDEFVAFCRAVGCEPMICVNAGDGTPEEAAAWVEYCNGAPDTPMGRRRADYGHPEPYGIRYWEIGNEIYGPWQVSWTTPAGNVDRFRRFRSSMLAADPEIELFGCGQGNEPNGDWNRRLIEAAGADLRCITDHVLTGGRVDASISPGELFHGFMGYPRVLAQRYADLRQRLLDAGQPTPRLAITELQLFAHFHGEPGGEGELSPDTMPRPDTLAEALYLSQIVHTCIRLGDFVEMLTHSATVNHGGGLGKARERVYPHPVHHAHAMGHALVGGRPLPLRLRSPSYSTSRDFGHIPPQTDVPVLDAMAVRAPAGDLVLMLVHRGAECGPLELTVEVEGGFTAAAQADTVTLAAGAWHERNTASEPERVRPVEGRAALVDGRRLTLALVPFSLTRVVLRSA